MEEMIKEVVEYVNPKPKEEVADPKGGKKKAAGKAEEALVDQYEGMDTTEFKEVGNQIRKFLGDGDLPAMADLVRAVQDDVLLVRLFIAKIKLTFPLKSHEEITSEIKENIAKEEEILA